MGIENAPDIKKVLALLISLLEEQENVDIQYHFEDDKDKTA